MRVSNRCSVGIDMSVSCDHLFNCSLTIYRVAEADSGAYGCEVRDSTGKVRISRNTTITVIPKSKTKTDSPVDTINLYDRRNFSSYDPLASPETEYLDSSAYDYDYKYYDGEEEDQAKQDAIDSCENNDTAAKISENKPYICFNFGHRKQMTHYLVRPAGTTVQLFCHVKGQFL